MNLMIKRVNRKLICLNKKNQFRILNSNGKWIKITNKDLFKLI